MKSYINASIHKVLVGVVHLWIAHVWIDKHVLPERAEFFVYDSQMDWGEVILKGKRIKITMEVEDDASGK